MSRRPSYTDRRRALLARRVDLLDQLENRSMITESLGLMVMGIGLHTAAVVGRKGLEGEQAGGRAAKAIVSPESAEVVPIRSARPEAEGGSERKEVDAEGTARQPKPVTEGDWIALLQLANGDGSTEEPKLAWKLPKPALSAGGGAAQPPRGGSGGASAGAISPLRLPPPSTFGNTSPSVVAGLTGPTRTVSPALAAARSAPSPQGAGIAQPLGTTAPAQSPFTLLTQPDDPGLFPVSGRLPGGARPTSFGGTSTGAGGVGMSAMAASFPTFTNFPVYVEDFNQGVTLFPGFAQLGTPGGHVDLRAQVRDTAVSSYSWDTSNLIDATSISGTSTYDLTFQWMSPITTPATSTVTLTVTDINSHTEVLTYTFRLLNPGTSDSAATWPESLAPDTVLASAPVFPSHNVTVDANSGALDTSIALPAYNPNVPGLALTYDSVAADARPIIVEHHQLDPSLAIPSQVSAQLTFDGTAGTTYYYDTSQFIPGDIQQLALQANATGKSTGRYNYSLSIGDIRTSTTATTVNGSATVLNYNNNAFGAGWTLQGLEHVYSASGGVILDLGGGDKSLWFTGSFGSGGGTFTNPNGEFSTLTQNSGGGYTRTLTDGTEIDFNSSGQQVDIVDGNGLRTTFAYDSGGKLTTITDPYNNVTTFSYSGGQLQTITDPANRVATFTHSGSNLTGVTLPDSSAWGYGYDGSGRLTTVTDPNSHTVSVAYDSAERVSTITHPDSSVETVTAFQEWGWTNSGTSLSPAAPTLLAEARSTYTDPLGNITDLRPDWNGQGLAGGSVDPTGNLTTYDRDINGLATVTIDPLSRITRDAFDAKGNVTQVTSPALTADQYTYNSFSEPTTHTDANSNTYTYTYDNHGNLTVVRDPLNDLTTMTYTANGMLATVKDARSNVTSYQYDSQDRLTTVSYPDGSTNLYGYDSQSNRISATDGNTHTTTYSFDALNRKTGMTDAVGNPTTYVYDSAGNQTVVRAPLSRTTSYAYDSMNRLTTVTDPLGHATVTAYDSGGNVKTITDPLGRVATLAYDPNNRPTALTDPLAHATTATYDDAGQTTQVQDPLTETTTYTYNSQGWQTSTIDPRNHTVSYVYSNTGKLLQQFDMTTTSATQYTYDNLDRVVTVTNSVGGKTQTIYDAVGNKIVSIDGNNNRTTYAYDAMNRLTTVTDPLSHVTVYGYDSGGNQITVKDPLGNVTTTAYDALNRATTVTDPLSDVSVTNYDAAGRQSTVVDPSGNRTTYGYDAADRLTTLTTPTGTATYVYDAANQLTDRTDADGRRTTFAYDSGGRQTAERWLTASGGTVRTISSGYDSMGRLTSISDSDATLTFTYDSGGNQLTARTSGTGGQPDVTLTSAFDSLNSRTSVADNLSTPTQVTYSYDLAERLTTIAWGSYNVVDGYDAANRLTSVKRTGGLSPVLTTLSYDAADRVTTITHASSFFGALATYVYGYDNANRLTSEQNHEGTVTYSYDNASQLTGASGSRAETYTYDSGGNRTMTNYSTGSANEMTTSPGYTYTYDAEGNLTGKTDTNTGNYWIYTFDYRNRLTGATEKNSGGTVISLSTYTYDPLNRRIETQVDDDGTGPHSTATAYVVYDGVNPWADFSSGGGGATLKTHYLYGPAIDDILARMDSGGTTAWYLKDKLGTVRDIVNNSGMSVLDHLSYDSYGRVLTESNSSNGDRFKFTGMQYDTATGLYFDNARYYDPSGGRFVSQDPKGFAAGDSNLYRYVDNAPTDGTDPTGTQVLTMPPTGTSLLTVSGGVAPPQPVSQTIAYESQEGTPASAAVAPQSASSTQAISTTGAANESHVVGFFSAINSILNSIDALIAQLQAKLVSNSKQVAQLEAQQGQLLSKLMKREKFLDGQGKTEDQISKDTTVIKMQDKLHDLAAEANSYFNQNNALQLKINRLINLKALIGVWATAVVSTSNTSIPALRDAAAQITVSMYKMILDEIEAVINSPPFL